MGFFRKPESQEEGIDINAPKVGNPAWIMALTIVVIAVLTVWYLTSHERVPILMNVQVPALNEAEARGQVAFNAYCAECHGENAQGGTGKGPTLMYPFYRYGYYPDDSIRMTIKEGRPRRLWKYGPMPAQPQVTDAEIEDIVAFFTAIRIANNMIEMDAPAK